MYKSDRLLNQNGYRPSSPECRSETSATQTHHRRFGEEGCGTGPVRKDDASNPTIGPITYSSSTAPLSPLSAGLRIRWVEIS